MRKLFLFNFITFSTGIGVCDHQGPGKAAARREEGGESPEADAAEGGVAAQNAEEDALQDQVVSHEGILYVRMWRFSMFRFDTPGMSFCKF